MEKKNLIIVDDHDFFRLGVRTAMATNYPDIAVVGEAKNGAEFFGLLKTTTVDMVLLDITLPGMNGVEIARKLKKEYPDIKILMISAEPTRVHVEELLNIGVEGFISKFESSMDLFVEAIRSIMQGFEYYGKDISQIISQLYLAKKKTAKITPEFSKQEKRIIEGCHQGLTGKQIADSLYISYKTMEWHKSNIFRKLDIHSTVELVHYAVKNGIIALFFLFVFISCSQKTTIEPEKITIDNTNYLKAQQFLTEANNDSALIYVEQAFLEADTTLFGEQANLYLLRSKIFNNLTLSERAMADALKALELSEQHGFTAQKATALLCIGNIHFRMYNDSEAEEYFLQAKAIAEENNLETEMMHTAGALGRLYLASEDKKVDRNDEGLELLNLAIEIAQKQEDTISTILFLIHIGDYYINLNRRVDVDKIVKQYQNQAKKYFDEAMELAKIKNATHQMNIIRIGLIRWSRTNLDYTKALEYAEQILQNAEPIPQNYSVLLQAYDHLVAIYAYLGNPKQAIVYHQHFYLMMINQSNYRMQQALQEMEVKYQTAKKEIELERHQTQIKQYRTRELIFIGCVAGLILLIAMLVYIVVLRTLRNRMLIEMNAIKDKMFSIISHDLKNPVVMQHNALQLLSDNATQWNTDTISEYSSQLLKSSGDLIDLLKNLLNWALVQSGRTIYNPILFNLYPVLQPELNIIKNMAASKNISFEVQIPQELFITADPNMLVTVVRNLLSNAIKFTAAEGTVTLEITECIVSVNDTGTGMTPEQLQNLFRIDRQQSHPGTSGEKGTGLGLIVCKEFLEKHGSTLLVESEAGKGSRFWFEI